MSDISNRWNDRAGHGQLGNSREARVLRAADKATPLGLAAGAAGATVALTASGSARAAAYGLAPHLPRPAAMIAAVAGAAAFTALGGIVLSMSFPRIFGE